jgi:hypothetical protein
MNGTNVSGRINGLRTRSRADENSSWALRSGSLPSPRTSAPGERRRRRVLEFADAFVHPLTRHDEQHGRGDQPQERERSSGQQRARLVAATMPRMS